MTFGNRARLEGDESMMRRVAGIEPQARPQYLELWGPISPRRQPQASTTGKRLPMAECDDCDPIKSELEALLAAAQERAAAEQEVAAEFTNSLDDPEYELQKNLKKIGSQFDQQLEDAQQQWETSRDAIVQQFEQEESGIKAQQLAELREIELEYGNEQEAAEKEKTDASWMVTSVLDDNAHDSPRYQYETFKKRLTSTKDRLAQQRREMDEVVKAATELMQDRRQWQGEGEIETVEKPETLEEAEELFQSSASKIEKGSAALRRQKLARIFGGVWPALLFVFAAAAICAPILMFVDPQLFKIEALNSRTTWLLTAAGGSALLVVIVMSILFGIARSKSAAVFEPIEQAAANLKAAHRRWQEFAKQELQERKQQYERRHADVIAQRERALANLETKSTKRLQDAETRKAQRLAEAEQKFPAMLADLERRREEKLGKLDEEFGKKKAELTAGRRTTLEAARRKTSEQTSQRRSRETEARGALAGKWQAATSKFFQMAGELREECERTSGHWSQLLDASWKLPDEVRVPIRVGSYDVDFEKIPDGMSEAPELKPDPPRVAVPFVLPFPGACVDALGMSGRRAGRRRRRNQVGDAAAFDLAARRQDSLHHDRRGRSGPGAFRIQPSGRLRRADDQQANLDRKARHRGEVDRTLRAHGERVSGLSPQRIRDDRGVQRAGGRGRRAVPVPRGREFSGRLQRRGGPAAVEHRPERAQVRRLHALEHGHAAGDASRLSTRPTSRRRRRRSTGSTAVSSSAIRCWRTFPSRWRRRRGPTTSPKSFERRACCRKMRAASRWPSSASFRATANCGRRTAAAGSTSRSAGPARPSCSISTWAAALLST